MKPITTPETNITFNAAEGDEENVLPLPAVQRPEDSIPGIYSTWELTDEEREQIAAGAHIEIGMAAIKPVPVGLAVVAPFCEKPLSDEPGAEECPERMEWSDELKSFVCPVVEE